MSDELKTKPCPKCGKECSTFPPAWARHQNVCNSNSTEEVQMSTAIQEVKETKTTRIGMKTEARSEEDRRLLERALAAQQEALVAPEIFVGEYGSDEHMQIREAYAPDTVDTIKANGDVVPAPMVAAFVQSHKVAAYAAKGWQIALNDHGDRACNGGGDVLVKIDRRLYEAREKSYQEESSKRIHSITKNSKQDSTKGAVGLENRDGDEKFSTENVLKRTHTGD
jgi:biotin carboxyl carrier protein